MYITASLLFISFIKSPKFSCIAKNSTEKFKTHGFLIHSRIGWMETCAFPVLPISSPSAGKVTWRPGPFGEHFFVAKLLKDDCNKKHHEVVIMSRRLFVGLRTISMVFDGLRVFFGGKPLVSCSNFTHVLTEFGGPGTLAPNLGSRNRSSFRIAHNSTCWATRDNFHSKNPGRCEDNEAKVTKIEF